VYHKTTKHYYRFKAMMEFDFDSFQHYLQSIAGGRKNKTSATAIAVELKNYYHFIAPFADSNVHYYGYLLNLSPI